MDDLTRCLYEFVCEKRMGRLSEDKEYKEAALDVELQEQRIRSYLNEEQSKELRWLIGAIALRNHIECEYVFQAALSLSRELNGLVRG